MKLHLEDRSVTGGLFGFHGRDKCKYYINFLSPAYDRCCKTKTYMV
jgi:hypothetical protein